MSYNKIIKGWAKCTLLTPLVILQAISPLSRADIAILREKGPASGSAFSNLGIAASSPDSLKVTMQTADVKITLRATSDGNLAADCIAVFELENRSPIDNGVQPFLVAFPVTGLRSDVVTVDKFAVSVDGKVPPTVLRRAITISRRQLKLEDKPIYGQLDATFAPENESEQWNIFLKNGSGYRECYLWEQRSAPGATTKVIVSYTIILRAQSIAYSKSYRRAEGDDEVVPFSDICFDKWNEPYFLLDYILLSGATWDGPIGREKIEISGEASLGLNPTRIHVCYRHAIGYRPPNEEPIKWQYERWSDIKPGGVMRLVLKNTKPGSDVLLAIPVSALRLPSK